MAALTKARNTPERGIDIFEEPVKAATKIYAGSLVCLDASGWAVPGAAATTLIAMGRAEADADNSSGADGDIKVRIKRGRFRWANSSSTDAIARTEIGKDVYIVDDQTVAKTNGSSSRSRAGKVVGVDSQGVWVATGIGY